MKHKTLFLSVILITVFIYACKKDKEITLTLKNKIYLPTNKDIDFSCFKVDDNENKEYIYFKSAGASSNDSIYICNSKGMLIESISLKYFVSNNEDSRVAGFYPSTLDSIYVTCFNSKYIYLINRNGIILKKIKPDFNKNYTFKDNDFQLSYGVFHKFGNSYLVNQYYNYSKLAKTNNTTNSYKKLFTTSPSFLIDINDSTYTYQEFGNYPDEFKSNKGNFFYYYSTSSKTINNNNQIIYLWRSLNKLYVYNKENKLVTIKEIRNKNFKPVELFPEVSYFDYAYLNDYTIGNGLYENILYDKYRKLYYISYRPAYTKEYLQKNKIQYACFAPFDLLILDENFNIINEINFPPNKYVCSIIEVCKEGLLIGNSSLGISDSTEKSVSLFEVKFKD